MEVSFHCWTGEGPSAGTSSSVRAAVLNWKYADIPHKGYETVGVNTNAWLQAQFGFAAGFEVYETRDPKDMDWTAALDFVRQLLDAPIPRIALENPVSVISTRIRKPDQIVQPWQFGHGETKATCLWLKNLPILSPTRIVDGRASRVHREPPGPDRWKNRSRTYQGIADAMADQWGCL